MAQILRVKLRWAGFTGAPGYSIFHMKEFDGADSQAQFAEQATLRINTFADKLKGLIPNGASLQVQQDVEVIEDSTGELLNVVSTASKPAITSLATASMSFAGPVGAVITWRTGGVRNGRRIRGRTFLVPLVGAAFDAQGRIAANNLTQLQTAAATLVGSEGSPDLGVYARPSSSGASDGQWTVATGYSIPNFGAVLRSRRD